MDPFKLKFRKQAQLLHNIKRRLPELKSLLNKINGYWYQEDCIYRFYHSSFKIYFIQDLTEEIVSALKSLAPKETVFDAYFEEIYKEGTGKKFSSRYNKKWTRHTRPMVECLFHAKYILEMIVKYGTKLKEPSKIIQSGWGIVLYFYGLR